MLDRLGPSCVHTGQHLVSAETLASGTGDAEVRARFRTLTAEVAEVCGEVPVAADGIHSTVRAQAHPLAGMLIWNGALLWRNTVDHTALLNGRTMVWAGHPDQKFVAYPILDLPNGRQRINFNAEYPTQDRVLAEREDWNRPGNPADFIPCIRSAPTVHLKRFLMPACWQVACVPMGGCGRWCGPIRTIAAASDRDNRSRQSFARPGVTDET